jgi:sulfur carrier protein
MSTIDINVNGEIRQVARKSTLQELVHQLELGEQALALAVNRTVVPRGQWPQRVLHERDRIDIVRAIGGG